MRVHYSQEYTIQKNESYNFAVYNDLTKSCGYVGWTTIDDRKKIEQYTEYGYIRDNQQGSFQLRQITKNEKLQQDQSCSGSGVVVKENQNNYSIVGIHNSVKGEGFIILSDKIRNIINQQTYLTIIDLNSNNISTQGCKYLIQFKQTHLISINLRRNKIDAEGCYYLSQGNWTHLTKIDLGRNNIRAEGCKYLSQANWTHLNKIILFHNNVEEIISRLLLLELYLTAIVI